MPKNQLPNYRSLIEDHIMVVAFAVAVIVMIIGYMVVIEQHLVRWRQITKHELPQLQQIRYQLDLKQRFLVAQGQNITFTGEERRLLNMAVPNDFDMASLTVQMSALASQQGLTVTQLEIIPQKEDETANALKKVRVKLSASGENYEQFKAFVLAIESSVLIVDVQSLTYAGQQGSYEVEFLSYVYPQTP